MKKLFWVAGLVIDLNATLIYVRLVLKKKHRLPFQTIVRTGGLEPN